MSKITSKYQVTIPKRIADEYNFRPGNEIEWVAAGEVIRIVPSGKQAAPETRETQLRLFDQATERHRQRSSEHTTPTARNRGWKREDLYARGRSH